MIGVIYKIESNNLTYIGSTCRSLSCRINEHKKKGLFKIYDFNINDFSIEILETIKTNDRDSVRKREQFYIDKHMCVNQVRAFKELTKKERDKLYYEKNGAKVRKRRLELHYYQRSWGGLIDIDPNIFKSDM